MMIKNHIPPFSLYAKRIWILKTWCIDAHHRCSKMCKVLCSKRLHIFSRASEHGNEWTCEPRRLGLYQVHFIHTNCFVKKKNGSRFHEFCTHGYYYYHFSYIYIYATLMNSNAHIFHAWTDYAFFNFNRLLPV